MRRRADRGHSNVQQPGHRFTLDKNGYLGQTALAFRGPFVHPERGIVTEVWPNERRKIACS